MKTKFLILFTLLCFTLPILADNTPVDGSGTITSGGTSQTVFAANGSRRFFIFQNISDETQYINFGAAATTDSNSIKIIAGSSWEAPSNWCPQTSITVIGATTNKKFIAKEGR
jgi:hypothetical protein